MKNSFLIFTIILLAFSSCKTAPVSDFSKVKQLIEGTTWYLQDDQGTSVGFNGKEVHLKFKSDDDGLQAFGFAGCNNYNARVDLSPERIKFGSFMSTMMACPEMDSEQSYMQLLELANGYEVTNTEFRLYQDKILLVRFKANK